jgi:hypothetical protein
VRWTARRPTDAGSDLFDGRTSVVTHRTVVVMAGFAFITEHDVIDAILRHLECKDSHGARAPPS